MADANYSQDAESGSWKTVCGVEDIRIGEVKSLMLDGKALCLIRAQDAFYCIDDTCSHEDYPLSSGEVDFDSCEIECYMHGSIFSLLTGEPQNLPATKPVDVYQVSVVGEEIRVLL
ncbi:MAG: non-heme iron oxygenase ferredoxin subunit [Firmicutes bacterium]|jgi:3-phenylpropionate/trans-cinnamate dioxygenase ferredoxin subunit|nr:non-heme iron oxygenase ferredoxin subunit [Bacillota bacterium]